MYAAFRAYNPFFHGLCLTSLRRKKPPSTGHHLSRQRRQTITEHGENTSHSAQKPYSVQEQGIARAQMDPTVMTAPADLRPSIEPGAADSPHLFLTTLEGPSEVLDPAETRLVTDPGPCSTPHCFAIESRAPPDYAERCQIGLGRRAMINIEPCPTRCPFDGSCRLCSGPFVRPGRIQDTFK